LPAYESRSVGDATIITIRTFKGPPTTTKLLERFVADYPMHAKSRLIVFDLRRNDGGDDHYALDWLGRAHRGDWQAYTEVDVAGGALYPCNTWNAVVRQQIFFGRVDDPSAREERAALRAKWSVPRPPIHVVDPGRVHDDAKKPYLGRVVVLVDRFTRSAGESAAFMIHQAMGARLVGERTAGYLEYGNARVLVLPRTQIAWWYGTKRNYYDGAVEGVGLPVDIYVDRIDAPVEELLPALRKL
jgi:C-terminal processing protease CtpA/Prc